MRDTPPVLDNASSSDESLSVLTPADSNLFSMHAGNSDSAALVTEEELRLLAEWPVADLISLLNEPEASVERYADDYILFHEKAGRIYEALLGSIQPNLLVLRFGVSGITYDYVEPFELSAEYLERLWKEERPVAHWIRQERDELNQVALLGRSYALADSALKMKSISGMNRMEAMQNDCYGAYLRQIYLRAFNLYGLKPLQKDALGIQGCDPCLQVSSRTISPVSCNGQQLSRYALKNFRDYQVSFESYSVLRGAPYTLSIPERIKQTNWMSIIQNEVSSYWLKGESATTLESILHELQKLENLDDYAQYHLS